MSVICEMKMLHSSPTERLVWGIRRQWLPLSLIAVIFALCVITVSNWFEGKIIYNWDQGFFPINTIGQFQNSFYVWAVNQSTGTVVATNLDGVLFFGIQWVFSLFLPVQLSAQAFLSALYFSGGVGMFLLIRDTLSPQSKQYRSFINTIALLGTLFYLLNPIWTLGGIVNPVQNTVFVVAFLPFLFLTVRRLVVSIIEGGKCSKLSFLGAVILANVVLPMTAVYVPFVLFLLLFYVIIFSAATQMGTHSPHRLRNLQSIALVVLAIVGSSLWYALPLYFITANQVLGTGEQRSQFISSSFSDLVANSNYTSILNDIRLVGFRIPPNIFPVSNPSAGFYSSLLFLFISTAFAVLIFIPLFFDNKHPDSISCTILSLLVIIGWAGVNPPLGFLYRWLFLNVHEFVIFRTPVLAFGYVAMFFFSLLFAQGVWLTTKAVSKLHSQHSMLLEGRIPPNATRVFQVVVIIILIMMVPYGLPIISGANMTSTYGVPSRIEVPSSYLQASDYLNSYQDLSTVLLLPPDANLHASSWYVGLNVFHWLLKNKGVITGGYGTLPAIQSMYNFYYQSLLENDTNSSDLNHILDILNSQFVVVQSDIISFPGVQAPANTTLLLKSLNDQPRLSNVAAFGNVTIFKNSDEISLIYAAGLKITSTESSSLSQLVSSPQFQPLTTAIYSGNVSGLYYPDSATSNAVDSLASTVRSLPRTEFTRMSPVDYSVTITNSTGPFFLVFCQTYDEQWKASIEGQYVSDRYHIAVNGYANAWYVNKSGSFKIDLQFLTQNQVYTLLVVSAISPALAYVMLFHVIPALSGRRIRNRS